MFIHTYNIFSVTYLLILMVQSKKPGSKRLLATWRLECELDIIKDPDCPIDGGWSHWAPWSTCYGACDTVGHRKRKRNCNNPTPSKDGLPCHGIEEQIESCFLKNCSVDDYRKIADGDPTRMDAIHQLEAVPIIMEKCLQIECPFEAIEVALAKENTWQLNAEVLWNALQCVKHDLGCSVNGEWGTWGTWSACGARCGKGLRWRLRKCDAPPPSMFHFVCLGKPLESQECEGDQCAIDGQYTEIGVSGSWSEWGSWTKCSERCGPGVRRRKRSCLEKHISFPVILWRTHCRGQYDEFEICKNKKCLLDGGWSGWGPWGQCSQTCGAGKRSRTRSCTRPIPAGGGANCVGSKIDISSCHLIPCEVYSHMVAIFNGDSYLQYNLSQRGSTFSHVYIRFLPLSPHGTLIRRGDFANPILRISLHKWHVCFDANGLSKTCSLPRICSPTPLKVLFWHSIMVTVTNEAVTARINDAPTLYYPFPCDPEFTYDYLNIVLGEKFHGEIQELIFNFMPISILINPTRVTSKSDLYPSSSSNMIYEKATIEEGFINLDNEFYLPFSCFEVQHEWHFALTLKSNKESGTIIFFINYNTKDYVYMVLENMRIKIKYTSGAFKSEAISSTECLPGQWLDIKLDKIKEMNIIEVSINNAERLHVLLSENNYRKRRLSNYKDAFMRNNSLETKTFCNHSHQNVLCTNEYFIGGVPMVVKTKISEDLPAFFGVLASLKVNNNLLDLHKINMERYKDRTIELSSRTASTSGSYREVTWWESNKLILTCVYARAKRLYISAFWLYLDTEIDSENVSYTYTDRVLKLVLSENKNRPGFYTCRASVNNMSRNFVTYGLLGKHHYKQSNPDMITILTFFTTVSLVIFTLGWLIKEGYNDVCDGYGFFRDNHPEEVLKNKNERNICESFADVVNFTQVSTRHRCTRQSSQLNASITGRILKLEQGKQATNENVNSELEELPDLPKCKNAISKSFINHLRIYRCEPTFISTSNHDSKVSSMKIKRSSSALDMSPERLIIDKKETSSRENSKKIICNTQLRNDNKPALLYTTKSSSFVNNITVQKVLQKFYNLKNTESES